MENIQEQINRLQTQLDALKNDTTMPLDIGNAIKARVGSSFDNLSANRLSIKKIPTSSTGLVAGDVWSNSGVLTIV